MMDYAQHFRSSYEFLLEYVVLRRHEEAESLLHRLKLIFE